MSTTDGPRVPERTVSCVFLPDSGSTRSSFLSAMRKRSCGKRAAMIATKLREPYMVPHRNQGNDGAKIKTAGAPSRRASLHDFEELSRLGLLVRIHLVDEFECLLLELVLG